MAAHLFQKFQTRRGGPLVPLHDVWINRDHVKKVERLPGSLTRSLVTFDDGDRMEVEGTPLSVATQLDA